LKLYIYGYVNEIRSSRKLERETIRNVEVMWLLRRLTPDHKTIANFRKDNALVLPGVFREFTKLCRGLQLFGAELVGIDGSKLRAVNSQDRNFSAAKLNKRLQWIEERIKEYLAALQREDEVESKSNEVSAAELQTKIAALQEKQVVYEGLKQQLAESGAKQISLTDADARLMKGRQGQHVSYNVQIAVDSKHKLVADYAVTNEGNDVNCLAASVLIGVTTTRRKSKPAKRPALRSTWNGRHHGRWKVFSHCSGLLTMRLRIATAVPPANV
jgi:hypothetical protein